LLEREVVPEFYNRDEHGIPRRWVARMRESMARLTPAFSTNRVVRQYTEDDYLPAAARFAERAANRGALGTDLLKWKAQVGKHWSSLRFGAASVDQQGQLHFFRVQVMLDDLDPEAVRVELYAEGQSGNAPERHPMNRGDRLVGAVNGFMYTARIPMSRPAADYTPRLVPFHKNASVPLDAPLILWHDSPSWR
jgi:starch phosphorylase